MILNGIDLSGLVQVAPALAIPEPTKGRIVHIDADFLAYQVSYESLESPKSFDDMKHNAREAVSSIKSLAGATGVHLHLTPSTSDKGGRYNIALLKEYQANREDKIRPRNLNIVREWMVQEWPGTLHQNCEADDGMSSAQYAAIAKGERHLSVIATKDKDLMMVPGLHLDWDTGEIIDVNDFGKLWEDEKGKVRGYGYKFFWYQMLTGDTADNISGLPRVAAEYVLKFDPPAPVRNAIASNNAKAYAKARDAIKSKLCGPKMAVKLLDECTTNQLALVRVSNLYKALSDYTDYRTGAPITWQQAFLSEAALLWMRVVKDDPNDVKNFFRKVHNGTL